MTKLTTHVLDVYSGKPGKGIKVDLYYVANNKKEKLNSIILNNDGRADQALIEGVNFKEGQYEEALAISLQYYAQPDLLVYTKADYAKLLIELVTPADN